MLFLMLHHFVEPLLHPKTQRITGAHSVCNTYAQMRKKKRTYMQSTAMHMQDDKMSRK